MEQVWFFLKRRMFKSALFELAVVFTPFWPYTAMRRASFETGYSFGVDHARAFIEGHIPEPKGEALQAFKAWWETRKP